MISIGIYPAGYAKHKMEVPQVGWFIKNWAGPYSKSGIPDILACIKGHFVALELKAPNGKPSELQKLNISQIQKSNGYACIVYPKDFENLKKKLLGLIRGCD